ncbi:methyltransferase domain-containing protein [Planktothrix mougeotii]|uniref:Methyltransferase domain-containing protein n=1 Tax=Planktothrix mougeotii LEGE 06226 TaxID=1828728 RepID=A0ABR9UC38_9CYAN|nr:methyltransferase domain-containing protein [Planktothrix mougeotii]MBE9144028.1 methyltransferase domain-containing protein [Planktothrix mougeotii LEGE 06226]
MTLTADTEIVDQLYIFRRFFANRYLQGNGIEVGALNHPLEVPASAHVKYVDRMSVPNLRKHYSELENADLVPVDIIDDGEFLGTLEDETQDFVIANHFIEHCQNPILTIQNLLRVIRKEGILYLAVPEKQYCFDRDRPVTAIEHLLKDYYEGPEWSRQYHYEEWVELVEKEKDETKAQWMVKQLMKQDLSIHFHVWTGKDFIDFLMTLKKQLNFPLSLEKIFDNGNELITIIKKL